MTRVLECPDCRRRTFYEKRRCLDCGADGLRTRDSGVGTVQAVTAVHVTPDGVSAPNRLGLASFDGDASIIARLEDGLEAGDSVVLETPDGAGSPPRLVPAETDRDRETPTSSGKQ
ncbi:Zn-ribbon domain-containing OB-fold protein [Natronococcus roseus]|uniref:Zn-ribbon domain-containing OB-fold protein n=1 Tax=Natronococcus roseus TaxID=1052014 RepID=UPI00374D8548